MKNEQRISEIVDEILSKERTLTDEPISVPIVLKRELPRYVQPIEKRMSAEEARRIQAEHDRDVACEVCKVLKECEDKGFICLVESEHMEYEELRARYAAKLEEKK